MITHPKRTPERTQFMPKTKGKYGEDSPNNVGVSHGSEIGALPCAIYQDDMMEGYDALNRESHLQLKHTHGRTTGEVDHQVQNEIRQQIKKQNCDQKQAFRQKLHIGQTTLGITPRYASGEYRKNTPNPSKRPEENNVNND